MKKADEDNDMQIRSFPLYAILICGIVILLVGIYLIASDTISKGVTLPGRFGQGGGHTITLTGLGAVIIGLGICVFPAYQLIKNSFKKR